MRPQADRPAAAGCGIRGRAAKRWRKTTILDPAATARADQVRRDFTADAAKINSRRRRSVSRESSLREPVSTQRGLALRAPNSTRKFLTLPSSSLDELLAVVDVEGHVGDHRVDHQVDG